MGASEYGGEMEGNPNRGHPSLSRQKEKKRERSAERMATRHILRGQVVGDP